MEYVKCLIHHLLGETRTAILATLLLAAIWKEPKPWLPGAGVAAGLDLLVQITDSARSPRRSDSRPLFDINQG